MDFLTKVKPFFSRSRQIIKTFLDNNCSMHAAGLTYFSLLAIVPVLCVLLLGARALKAEAYVKTEINRQIEIAIENIEHGQDDDIANAIATDDETREARRQAAQEFGRQARDLTNKLFSKIETFDVKTLGFIGFLFLLWTVISSIGMVEVSFNEIWEVPKPRPVWKRALLYLSLVIAVPVLGALAMSVPVLNITKNVIIATLGATWLTQWVSNGLIALLDSWAFRFILTLSFSAITFAFIFFSVPNCKVSFRAAWRGGFLTALLFGLWMKACAVAQVGIAKSSALYGSFAFFPIVLAWFYMSWQIVLFGACIARATEKAKLKETK